MCFGPRKTTKLEIGDMADELVSVEEDENVDPRPDEEDDDESEDAVLLSDKARSDSMIFPGGAAEDGYAQIGSSDNSGCDALCRYRVETMSASMGMFQVSTFLLNIESFMTNICLSIYFCFYCTVMETDYEQRFIKSAGQMSITGVVVVSSVLAIYRCAPSVYYYYWFRVGTNICCISLSVVMVHLYEQRFLYWFIVPVAVTMLVLLDVSTHLLLSTNTPNGCIAFIFGSNQVFQLTAFIIGPLLMGLFCDFDADDNTLTYWSITSTILALQLLITVLIAAIQGIVMCCCSKGRDEEDKSNRGYTEDVRRGYKQTQHDPTDMENE